VAIAISHCNVSVWRWALLHAVCLKGAASAFLQIRRKKIYIYFIKKDVTSSNKCLCELLKAILFMSVGDDFLNSCIREILA